MGLIGCRDNTPPPPRVPIPAQDRDQRAAVYGNDEMKPLAPPPDQSREFRPPYDDAPIVNQRPPEQRAFVDAYRQVGSPRITLFVNRTLEGTIVPSSGRDTRDPVNEYLQPGQYDEANAKSLDYQAIETILTDWLAANGQVTVISPTMARQRMTEEQVRELQEGRPVALREIAQQLDADILIQVQAHPTKQTRDGLEFRVISEAINTKDGQSIGRAVVDVVPPLEKTTINRSTRFLARKLMDDMIQTWSAPPPPARERAAAAAPPQLPERSIEAPPPAPTRPPAVAPAAPPSTFPATQP
ncbi:MAG: hypothetical protein H7Z14_01400 [Anaerolineae bacterium]|nr:hypothetical protein [Phycisphaerae bacterium]